MTAPDSRCQPDIEHPRVTDNDAGDIAVTFSGKELRGWSYKDDTEQRTKMFCAREYVEGWCDGRDAAAVSRPTSGGAA